MAIVRSETERFSLIIHQLIVKVLVLYFGKTWHAVDETLDDACSASNSGTHDRMRWIFSETHGLNCPVGIANFKLFIYIYCKQRDIYQASIFVEQIEK